MMVRWEMTPVRDLASFRLTLIHSRIARSAVRVCMLCAQAVSAAVAAERLEFTRLIAHWSGYADPGYLAFVDDLKPEIAQVGFYGAHFWSLADTPFGSGYPAHLPVRGHRECGDWFARLNTELHRRGVKVVGHMNVKFLVGDPDSPDGPRSFFRFYRNQWDEKMLGVKPVADPIDLLEKDKTGKPISHKTYSTGDMANHTDLASGLLGEGTLQARYIRGAFDDKPFTLGKYESVRIRAAIAELAANGGAPMGFYTAFEDPEARRA